MADTDIIVSQLPNASQVNASDLVMLTQPNAQAETGYSTAKTTMGALAAKVGNGIEFTTDLSSFTNKTLTGAINENKDSILALLPIDEVSGAVANFDTDVVLPLIDVKAEIKAVETGTGAKSPSNPYVISGFTGMDLYQRGANLCDEVFELGDISASTGENEPATTVLRTKNYIPVKPDTQYFPYIGGQSGYTLRTRFYDRDKNFIGTTQKNGTVVNYNIAFTTPVNAYYMRFTPQASYGTTYNNDISINYPSTDTEYHAHTGTTFPVSWQTEAGEVFGGYYDFTTGKLVVTHTIGSLAIGANLWNEDPNRAGVFYGALPQSYGRKERTDLSACSCFNATNPYATTAEDLYISGKSSYGGSNIFFRNSAWTGKTSSEINTLLANETFVYELVTPVEIDLSDASDIVALVGTNNVWSDTNGDTTVDYKLGIQKYIDKKIAEVQALVL